MKTSLLLLGVLIVISCKSPTESFTKQIEGTYNYTAYDSNNQIVVTGTLIISQTDSTHIKGTWQLVTANNAPKTGPQSGTGNLAGTINKDTVSINLNPNFADNNVLLHGNINSFGFSGGWEWSGFAGKLNEGSFNAIRKGM